MNNYQGSIKINIKELCILILKQWKIGIISILVFGCLMGGLSYYKSYKNSQISTVDNAENDKDFDARLDAVGLSGEKKEKAERAAGVIYKFEKTYAEQERYAVDSIYINLDANRIPMAVLNYYVDNKYENEYPVISSRDNTGEIKEAVCARAKTDVVCDKIAEATGYSDKKEYISELIKVSTQHDKEETDKNLVIIKIYGPDTEFVKKASECVKEELDVSAGELTASLGKFDLNLVSEDYITTTDTELFNQQRTAAQSMANINTSLDDFSDKLDADVLNYARIRSEQLLYDDKTDNSSEDVVEAPSELSSTKPSVSKKYVLAGMILGAFLVAAVVTIWYIINNKLIDENDLARNYDVNYLGKLDKDNKSVDMIAAKIKLAIDGSNNVLIAGSVDDESISDAIDGISKKLSNEKINVIKGKSLITDADTLMKMVESSFVVLVEQPKKSLYSDIYEEIELIKKNNKNVAGVVIVE